MTDKTATDSDRATGSKGVTGSEGALPDPPASNQGKDEPIATTPSDSPQSSDSPADGGGQSSRTPGDQGSAPRAMEVDDVRAAANAANAATMPAHTTGGVPTPGDSKGVAVPAVQAAAGSSEESEEIQNVKTTSLAPPGKPDGEVDTRG